MNALIARIPTEHRVPILETLLIIAAFIVGFAANYEMRATVIRQTHTVHVKQSFGKPDQTIQGAQINPNLAGFTCDVYQAKQTIICHRP